MKDEYTSIKFLLVGGKTIQCKISEWEETISTNNNGYNNHFHIINKQIEGSESTVAAFEKYVIPQSAVVLITFW